jgi:hypothetical protein
MDVSQFSTLLASQVQVSEISYRECNGAISKNSGVHQWSLSQLSFVPNLLAFFPLKNKDRLVAALYDPPGLPVAF